RGLLRRRRGHFRLRLRHDDRLRLRGRRRRHRRRHLFHHDLLHHLRRRDLVFVHAARLERAADGRDRADRHEHLHLQRDARGRFPRSEEHTSELQSQSNLVCRLLLEKKKNTTKYTPLRQQYLSNASPHCCLPPTTPP